MVRVAQGGSAIALEVWALPAAEFGSFVAGIPAPLGIGTVLLQDGTSVQGFVCEELATREAKDVSHLGGWRAYLQSNC
jgi:allophanate hydrolase